MTDNTFTLEDLKAATRKKFAPFEIRMSDGTVVSLIATIRLDADKRKAVNESLMEISNVQGDESAEKLELVVENISKIFYAVADKPAKLLAELAEDDLAIKAALMSRVLSAWMGDTEAGEA